MTTQTEPHAADAFPYPAWEYPARALWRLVQLTVWPLAWRRLYWLRAGLLKLFGARTSWRVGLSGTCRIERPWGLQLGAYCSVGPRVRIYNLGEVVIGARTVISQDADLCGGTHDHTHPRLPLRRLPVRLGADAWICAGAFIGPGVTVGDGAVVGARAVVVKDVAPWTVVAGNPARFVKARVLKGA
jgi:putative colanic acid biosynthesis acetyltransferase WcaF